MPGFMQSAAGYADGAPVDPTDLEDEDAGAYVVPPKPKTPNLGVTREDLAESLTRARQALMADRSAADSSAKWLAFAAAVGKPTKTGTIGEAASNVAEAMGEFQKQKRADERQRLADMLGVDVKLYDILSDAETKQLGYEAALARASKRRTGFNPVTGELVFLDTGEPVTPGAKPAQAGPPQAPPVVQVPTGDGKTVPMMVTRGPQGRVEYTPIKPPELTLEEVATRAEQIAEAKKTGENRAEAKQRLPAAISATNNALGLIDTLVNHPGMPAVIGMPDPFKGGFGFADVPGSPAAGFRTRLKQLEGGAFLEAFNTLRGGGQITEKEGEKATSALLRAQTAQSEDEFRVAMQDYKNVLLSGISRLRAQAAGSTVPIPTSAVPTRESAGGGAKPLTPSLQEQYSKVPPARQAEAKRRLQAAGYDISGLR